MTFDSTDNFVPTRVVEYYKDAEPLSKENALTRAHNLANQILQDDFCPVLEYGIVDFDIINKTWDEIVADAKVLAFQEIQAIRNRPLEEWERKSCWYANEIDSLESIMAM